MSNNQSSSIRVKTSKNPWNKKKNTKPAQITNTKKSQQKDSISPRNDAEHWPDLKTKSTTNSTPSPPNIKETTSASNTTQSNGHHVDNISSPSTTKLSAQDTKSNPNNTESVVQDAPKQNTPHSPKKKRKKRKKKSKSNAIMNDNAVNTNDNPQDTESSGSTPHKSHPHSHSHSHHSHSHKPPVSNISIAKDDNQHSPKNGYTLSRVHQDVPHRNYNNYNYRRGNRGRRRGRGRGGYRNNNNYDDDHHQSQEYHRGYRNKRRFTGGGNPSSSAPRHNKDRYRNHYNRNNNRHNRQHHNNQHNNGGYDMNMNNNNNLWPQQQANMQFVAVPIMPMGAYQMAPAVENNGEKKTEGGEERKSDTNNTATPAIIIPPMYNPYALNMPYLFGQNMFGEPAIDTMHLMMNQMQQPPEWAGEVSLPLGPYYVLKVSCVATGYSADDRSVGHIALTDWSLKTKANIFVKPQQEIVSYIEPLTSLNAELLDKYGYSLDQAITIIKSELPSNAVIIGQNITMDIQWLGLKAGEDFKTFVDLRDVWRSWSEYYNSYTHYSLNHQAKCILNVENAHQQKHSASFDAITTMKLFQYYLYCRYFNMTLFHNKINVLQSTKIEPSFAKRNPVYEGVQMQSKKYKGVPYITATPKKMTQTTPQKTAIITPTKSTITPQKDALITPTKTQKDAIITPTKTAITPQKEAAIAPQKDNDNDDTPVVKVIEATKAQ